MPAPSSKVLSETARFVRAVRESASGHPSSRGDRVTAVAKEVDQELVRRTVAAVCEAYAASVQWEIVVPGNRTKDLSSMALFEILRDKHGIRLLDTNGVRPKIEAALKARFKDRVPNRGAMNAVASKIILETAYGRFRRGHGLDTGILQSQLKTRGYIVYSK